MRLDIIILLAFYVFAAIIAAALLLQRFLWKRRKRQGKPWLGFYPTSASLGDALQTIQSTAQPQIQYVLEEKKDESVEEDDEGGPENPTEHLRRQSARKKK